jgi:succinoglycan biosynthesis transport protein ExoP
MDKESVKLNDVTDLFRRRWPAMAAVFLTVVLAAIVIAYSLDDLYAGTGTIDIEKSDASGQDDSTNNRELRIYRVNDDVMTRENLAAVVEKFNLYPEIRGDDPPRSVVWLLRKNTQLEVLRKEMEPNSRDVGPVVGFSVTYFHESPELAKAVAKELQDMFLAENNSRSAEAINDKLVVLASEQEETRERLEDIEQALVDFKKRNPGAMPEDLKRVQQQIDRKADEQVRVDGEIRTLQARRDMLQTQINQTAPYETVGQGTSADQLESLQREYIRLMSLYGADHPDVQRVRRQLEGLMGPNSTFALRQILEQQLAEARQYLAELEARTAADHPDRRAQERKISGLVRQLEALPNDELEPKEPTNPVYVNLQLQLDATNRELWAQMERRKSIRSEIEDLELKLNIAPEVARELTNLLRDYKIVEDSYTAYQRQIEDLKTRIGRVDTRFNEIWEVKKPPTLPYFPVFPNRPLYIVLGIFLGLTLGIGAGLIAEALDGTIRSTRDIRHVMQMPPIAAIPVIKTASDVRRDRIRHVAVATCVLVAVGAVGLYVRLQTTGTL